MKAIWRRIPTRPSEADDHTVVPDAVIAQISELPTVLEKLYNDGSDQ